MFFLGRSSPLSRVTCPADLCMDGLGQGVAPWEIEYSVVGQRTRTISDITKSPYAFDIQIPSSIAKHGGQFALSLGTSTPVLLFTIFRRGHALI